MWRLLQDGAGAAVVNISDLARRSGYSRPTIDRALAFFTRFGKVLPIGDYHTGQGHPGRPMKYRFNPTFVAQTRKTSNRQEKGACSKRVNPSYQVPQEDQEINQPRPSTGPGDSKTTSDKKRLTRWLTQADINQPPTDQERRKLSVAIRLMVPQILVNPLLDVLWWRTKAPLQLWRDVIGAVWFGVSVPDASEKKLVRAVSHGLTCLQQDGDREAFLDALEQGPLEEQARNTERRLEGLKQWRIAQGENCNGERLSWFVETRRELERKLEEEEARQRRDRYARGSYSTAGARWTNERCTELSR